MHYVGVATPGFPMPLKPKLVKLSMCTYLKMFIHKAAHACWKGFQYDKYTTTKIVFLYEGVGRFHTS